jgi:hypothetical protein
LIDRILDDEAAIKGLVEYFEPDLSLEAVDFGDEVSDAILDCYRLSCDPQRTESPSLAGPSSSPFISGATTIPRSLDQGGGLGRRADGDGRIFPS